MNIHVKIPSFKKVNIEHEKSFTVFCVEVTHGGRSHSVERRYTDFEELHKKLKRSIATPVFPPKTVMKWNLKVLESRRQAFETYLQALLCSSRLPRSLLAFLEISLAEASSGSMESLDRLSDTPQTHQPIIAFVENTFLSEPQKGSLPDILVTGVTQGLYGSADDLR